MYFVLYDRFLRSIGETYLVESWSRTQRSSDFDSLNIVGELVPYAADPFLVVVNNKEGGLAFSGLASTPVFDEKAKKVRISLKDYTTLWNTDILIDWSKLGSESEILLSTYIDFILQQWINQTDVGFDSIYWDTTLISDVVWDSDIPIESGVAVKSVYSVIQHAMDLHSLYCMPHLDVWSKTLTFKFYKGSMNHISLRLSDFNLDSVEKSFGDYNRATIYDYDYTNKQEWGLTVDNSVVKLPSDKILVYPAKNRMWVSSYQPPESIENPTVEESKRISAYNNAVYEAVMGLSENRFQESIDIDLQKQKPVIDLSSVDFSYSITVYTEDGIYKKLPVGEILTDSNGKHIIRLGHRIQELTQEI